MSEDFTYIGDELDIFQHAKHWKRYWREQTTSYMGQNVLEVGAGIGANTKIFADTLYQRWVALEPDPQMCQLLQNYREQNLLPANSQIWQGTIDSLPADEQFDTILYIDVLEHIEDDRTELELACKHLELGGHIIVLSPAFQFLYTPFDESIGHYRRYTRKTLLNLTPQNLTINRCFYLDSVGLLASMGNLLLLKQSMPSLNQILFWDRFLVPPSRLVDTLISYQFGRSIIAVWERTS